MIPELLVRFSLRPPETESSSMGFGSGARKCSRAPNPGLGSPLGEVPQPVTRPSLRHRRGRNRKTPWRAIRCLAHCVSTKNKHYSQRALNHAGEAQEKFPEIGHVINQDAVSCQVRPEEGVVPASPAGTARASTPSQDRSCPGARKTRHPRRSCRGHGALPQCPRGRAWRAPPPPRTEKGRWEAQPEA